MSAVAPLGAEAGVHPPDHAARRRIVEDLRTNLLVEAGAGSGKTRQLVARMVALVRDGRPVERLAAVTFTRKAAAELNLRLRSRLEEELAEATQAEDRERLETAVQDVHLAFVGTIHAFCARLLRENPLEARVDPGFDELGEAEAKRAAEDFWHWRLEERHAAADPVLARLAAVGIDPSELKLAFESRLDDSDVVFPSGDVPEPDVSDARDRLLALVAEAEARLAAKPAGTPLDDLQKTLRRLAWARRSGDWNRPGDFLAALERISKTGCNVKQYCWAEDGAAKKEAKRLGESFAAFRSGVAQPLLERWYAHRYAVVLEFLDPLLRDFAEHRRRAGRLTFQDLLQLAVELMRDHPDVRRRAGRRWTHLLVDEFQDTDPLQAELCLLLASEPEEGNDWLAVQPRPGALFVVGDPKQSIYRFRRADLAVYEQVARRFEAFGTIVRLTANFRSSGAVGRFVDTAFRPLLAERGTPEQAAFAEMNTLPERDTEGCVARYAVPGATGVADAAVARADAARVASWIAERIARDRRRPGDFLVLPYRKYAVATYARELERRGVAVTTSGAGLTVERELRELLVLLHALDEPQDEVWTVAALEGLFFGLDPGVLWEHRAAGRRLSYERAEFDAASPVDRALQVLRRWSRLCRDLPVDGALESIVEEIGLLPLAAAGEIAGSRAGSLVHALEAVAAAATRGAADLRSAIEAVEDAVDSPEVEAPLRPGRTDAVRVMNLHKAKGLQGKVVLLVHPAAAGDERPVARHVRRAGGRAEGFLRIQVGRGNAARTIAQPAEWRTWEHRERQLLAAEWRRLLYVAATRAEDELVVAERPQAPRDSPWHELTVALERLAEPLELVTVEPPPLPPPDLAGPDVERRVGALADARAAAGRPAYSSTTPSAAELPEEEEAVFRGGEGRGREWGTVVHRAIASAGRGREGESLRRYVRGLLRDAGLPSGEGDGTPVVEILGLIERLRRSETWTALAGPGSRWELTVAGFRRGREGDQLVTGTVDAARIGNGGERTLLVDWKTDAVEGSAWDARQEVYAMQVEAYRRLLENLTGGPAEGRLERVR